MKTGIYFDGRNPAAWSRPWSEHYTRIVSLAVEAERLGIGAVWLSEHHLFDDGYLPQPLTLAAAIAARTKSVRVGTAVLLPAFRHPLQLAEEAAVVDILSAGRLELGFGAGYRPAEFVAFGVNISERYERVERTIREMVQLWEGVATPAPIQRPVPLWGGFFGRRGARLAGRLGMGLLSLDPVLLEPYQRGLAEGAHPLSAPRLGGAVRIVLADDPEAAWSRIAPHLAYQSDSYNDHTVRGTNQPLPSPVDPERLRRPRRDGNPPYFQVLAPEEAYQFVKGLIAVLPVEHVFFWSSVGAMPDDLEEQHIKLLSTQLAPRLAVLGIPT